jgi:hypothetical protein
MAFSARADQSENADHLYATALVALPAAVFVIPSEVEEISDYCLAVV